MYSRQDISPKRKLITWRIGGPMRDDDLRDGYAALLGLPGWHPAYDELIVFEPDAALGEITAEKVEALLADLYALATQARDRQPVRTALVCLNPASLPLLKFWEHLTIAADIPRDRAFSNEQDARDWLGQPA